MLACRTTEDARAFMDTGNNAATLAAIDKVKQLGEAVPYGQSSAAFLCIDTRRFSQFTVNNLKYEVLINGIEKDKSHGNLATTLSLEVMDSVGISFINFLQWVLTDKMQCNYDGMIFMLRVMFVGHRPDGSTTVVQNETIPMHLFNMKLDLDHSKGVYQIEFMPNMNFDTSTHSRWLNIASSTSYATATGSNKLGDMINNFETLLNDGSKKYFDDASNALASAGRQSNAKGKFGRLVQYMITIPKEWESFECTGSGTVNATETVYKAVAATNNAQTNSTAVVDTIPQSVRDQIATAATAVDTNITVPNGTTITEVLDTLFGQTKEVSGLGKGDGKPSEAASVTFYKYITGITSTDEVVTVHVDVVPFVVPNVLIPKSGESAGVGQHADEFYQEIDGKRVPKNYAEYDYIFTGKNVDILSFDMKLQDLQWLIASNLDSGPGILGGANDHTTPQARPSNSVNGNEKPSELAYSRPYDALLPPINTAAELDNFSRYASIIPRDKNSDLVRTTQDYARNLSMFYAASPITANLVIKGNPDIMNKFNMKSFLPAAATAPAGQGGAPTATDKAQYRQQFEATILSNNQDGNGGSTLQRNADGSYSVQSLGDASFTQTPVFVKVNIFGPNVDFVTADTVRGEDFSKAIIQDNYYVVMKVINEISGSDFKQTLELYSHNVFGNGQFVSPTASTQTPKAV